MEQKIDLFTPIHKAIRALIYHMGGTLLTTDFSDDQEANSTFDALEKMLDLLEEHAHHEDNIVFPPIEKASPGISQELEVQHQEGEEKVSGLQVLLKELRTADTSTRIARANILSIYFTDLIAFYLSHMNREEETVLPVSQQLLSNEELTAIRVRIQMNTSPERYAEWMRWMLPALNIRELAGLYRQVKNSAPAPVFEKIQSIGREVIDEARWQRMSIMAD